MSEVKHTPGPWHRNIRAEGKYPVVFAGRNNHVATVSHRGAIETEANIDLIAAAPELLAAVQAFLAAGTGNSTDHIRQAEAHDLARRAIDKAEGRGG